jgi:ribosomal protein L40E
VNYNTLTATYNGKVYNVNSAPAPRPAAITHTPTTPGLEHNNKGNAFFNKGDYKNAISEYQAALQSLPNDAQINANCANAFIKIGDYAGSLSYWQAACNLDNTHQDWYNQWKEARLAALQPTAQGSIKPVPKKKGPSWVVTCASYDAVNKQWIAVVSQADYVYDNYWIFSRDFPRDEIAAAWAKGWHIDKISWGGVKKKAGWLVLMKQGLGWGGQSYYIVDGLPTDVQSKIWTTGRITDLAFNPETQQSVVVTASNTEYDGKAQITRWGKNFPPEGGGNDFQKLWDGGEGIHRVGWTGRGDWPWCALMSAGVVQSEQSYWTGVGSPQATIDDVIKQGFAVTDVCCGISGYVALGAKGCGLSNQRVFTGAEFPGDDVRWFIDYENKKIAKAAKEAPPLQPVEAPKEAPQTAAGAGGNVCVKCGAPLEDGAKFCTVCGAKQPAKKPAPKKAAAKKDAPPVCAKCGAVLEPGAKFCTTCGTPVPVAETKAKSKKTKK